MLLVNIPSSAQTQVSYPTDWNAIVVLDMLGGLVFLLDIAINFRTGFEIFVGKTRRVVMKPKVWRRPSTCGLGGE